MAQFAIGILVGLFIGWIALPEPQWAANGWTWLKGKIVKS